MSLLVEYIAGFFDGEGCITSQAYYSPGKYEKYPRIALHISLSNTKVEVLQRIAEQYGGVVSKHKKQKNANYECYHLSFVGKQRMKKLLEDLFPFLIIKRGEALLALQFIETIREENFGPLPLDENIHDIRREIHEKLRKRKSISIQNLHTKKQAGSHSE